MDDRIDKLFQVEPEQWLEALPSYQRKRTIQLLEHSHPEEAARKWLSAIPEHTFPFGAEKGGSVFIEKVWDEVEKFLCGHEQYEEQRGKLLTNTEIVRTTFISSVSAAIAPVIGTAAIYILPVVALLLMTMGTITVNAWCQMRAEARARGTDQDGI